MEYKQIIHKGQRGGAALAYFIGELPENIAFYTGVEMTGFTLKKREGNWLLIVNGRRAGKKVVCFIDAPSHVACFRVLLKSLQERKLAWSASRY